MVEFERGGCLQTEVSVVLSLVDQVCNDLQFVVLSFYARGRLQFVELGQVEHVRGQFVAQLGV